MEDVMKYFQTIQRSKASLKQSGQLERGEEREMIRKSIKNLFKIYNFFIIQQKIGDIR